MYAKKPFGKPENVIEYLGRYSHKVAISNHRILDVDTLNNSVKFSAKNYRKGGQLSIIEISMTDFINRFQLHILPKRFTRIRHYGCLSSSWKKDKLPRIQAVLLKKHAPSLQNQSVKQNSTLLRKCPTCKKGTLITIAEFSGRAPPKNHVVNILSQYQYI